MHCPSAMQLVPNHVDVRATPSEHLRARAKHSNLRGTRTPNRRYFSVNGTVVHGTGPVDIRWTGGASTPNGSVLIASTVNATAPEPYLLQGSGMPEAPIVNQNKFAWNVPPGMVSTATYAVYILSQNGPSNFCDVAVVYCVENGSEVIYWQVG